MILITIFKIKVKEKFFSLKNKLINLYIKLMLRSLEHNKEVLIA